MMLLYNRIPIAFFTDSSELNDDTEIIFFF